MVILAFLNGPKGSRRDPDRTVLHWGQIEASSRLPELKSLLRVLAPGVVELRARLAANRAVSIADAPMFRQGKFAHRPTVLRAVTFSFQAEAKSEASRLCWSSWTNWTRLEGSEHAIRTPWRCGAYQNKPVIRRHRPMVRSGTIGVLLSCRWSCREAGLSSSLSSELSSHYGA
jgi:hypothetical protein